MSFLNLKDVRSAIACSRSRIFESLVTAGFATIVYFQESSSFNSDATINKYFVESWFKISIKKIQIEKLIQKVQVLPESITNDQISK